MSSGKERCSYYRDEYVWGEKIPSFCKIIYQQDVKSTLVAEINNLWRKYKQWQEEGTKEREDIPRKFNRYNWCYYTN